VWISLAGAAPTYAFSVSKQATTSDIAGVGLRTNNADIERFFVNDVLLQSGATFDRSAVPEPASVATAALFAAGFALSRRVRSR
jgi:hypothetical protein